MERRGWLRMGSVVRALVLVLVLGLGMSDGAWAAPVSAGAANRFADPTWPPRDQPLPTGTADYARGAREADRELRQGTAQLRACSDDDAPRSFDDETGLAVVVVPGCDRQARLREFVRGYNERVAVYARVRGTPRNSRKPWASLITSSFDTSWPGHPKTLARARESARLSPDLRVTYVRRTHRRTDFRVTWKGISHRLTLEDPAVSAPDRRNSVFRVSAGPTGADMVLFMWEGTNVAESIEVHTVFDLRNGRVLLSDVRGPR